MKSRIERVSPEFSEMLNNLKNKTSIPKVQITKQIAKQFKFENTTPSEMIIDFWPINHKIKIKGTKL